MAQQAGTVTATGSFPGVGTSTCYGCSRPPPPQKKLATAGGGSGGKGTEQNLIMAGGTLVCFVWVFIHSSGSMAQIQEETVLFTVYLRETVPYIMWVCILDSMA